MWSLSAAAAAAALALMGGSITLPVHGATVRGDETFAGTATARSGGTGTIALSSSHGLRCRGTFAYAIGRGGTGTFRCSNGQGGPFAFVSTGTHGKGSGTVGRRKFRFTFG